MGFLLYETAEQACIRIEELIGPGVRKFHCVLIEERTYEFIFPYDNDTGHIVYEIDQLNESFVNAGIPETFEARGLSKRSDDEELADKLGETLSISKRNRVDAVTELLSRLQGNQNDPPREPRYIHLIPHFGGHFNLSP